MSDQFDRDRIARDLDLNLLVEAGAGSGKTTSLVARLVALVVSGTPVHQVAAVTFTRQAAAELRERFQEKLEEEARGATDPGRRTRLAGALAELDRAFLGTIHAFAARLLREQALEAGIDPTFTELDAAGMLAEQEQFWDLWVERLHRDNDPDLIELADLGVEPLALLEGFRTVAGQPDVEWPGPASPAPDPAVAIARLRKLVERSVTLMPSGEPAAGWCELQRLIRQVAFLERTRGTDRLPDAMHALALVKPARCKPTQNRWSADKEGKAAAKALGEAWQEFESSVVAPLLARWREHRYGPVMRLLRRAAAAFQEERRRAGRLGFEDLLAFAARLLRENPAVRRGLGERYRHLLVDEFQDTDPLQAELCFLLASDPDEGSDWRTVSPRPGALFVVGDPKQSIYRFRRADLGTYTFVRQRFEEIGEILRLTRNFRSVPPVAALVNAHFPAVFPGTATELQAPFAPMDATQDTNHGDGIYRYVVRTDGSGRTKGNVVAADAAQVAGWVAEQVASGRIPPSEFMILTPRKAELAAYASAIAAHGIPVITSGAELQQERELRELVLLLRLLADPGNSVLLVAVLEGIFVGLSPEQLHAARRERLELQIQRPPREASGKVAKALLMLHRWWHASRRLSSDQLLDRILDDTGLLPYAVSQPLGEERAGALLHLVETVRQSEQGMTGLRGMIEVLQQALDSEDGVPVLRPGRGDAVRVMNLHKAKGLEAAVVILAAPVKASTPEPRRHVSRGPEGQATGWLQVTVGGGSRPEVLAQPPEWAALAADESALLEAERDRLLYVATTRPKRMLLVAEREDGQDSGLWGRLAPVLSEQATLLELPERSVPTRSGTQVTSLELLDKQRDLCHARKERRVPTFEVTTVTRSLRQDRDIQRSYDLPLPRDEHAGLRARGDAIHRVLEAKGRGRTGASLRAFAVVVARELELEAAEVDGILAAADGITGQPAWRALQAGSAEYELPVMLAEMVDGVTRLTEGVIDAVVETDGVWQIFDWKSGRTDGERWEDKLRRYQQQVDRYQEILQAAGLRAEGATVVKVRGG
ncbi:MAG TPA: UvrD-helicase domain-containing protein [Gemmatimonadales bacterium]|nr:UvrD-helicase domain-containing protein [Gemmatimonadales bacterium]